MKPKEVGIKDATILLFKSISAIIVRIFYFFIFIFAIWWIFNKIYSLYYESEKKPFWKGTKRVQVCKVPYYSSKDCYQLDVSLLDNNKARINFNNGGYLILNNLTCYFAAKIDDGPRYVFCRSWDKDNNRWDLLPNWRYY